jgi:hypothetical protein
LLFRKTKQNKSKGKKERKNLYSISNCTFLGLFLNPSFLYCSVKNLNTMSAAAAAAAEGDNDDDDDGLNSIYPTITGGGSKSSDTSEDLNNSTVHISNLSASVSNDEADNDNDDNDGDDNDVDDNSHKSLRMGRSFSADDLEFATTATSDNYNDNDNNSTDINSTGTTNSAPIIRGDEAVEAVGIVTNDSDETDNTTTTTTDQQHQLSLQQTGIGGSSSYDQQSQSDCSSAGDCYTDGEEEENQEECDSEVLLAKEMALAIAKNPTMTPTQLRELQQQVLNDVEERKKERSSRGSSFSKQKKSNRKKKKKRTSKKEAGAEQQQQQQHASSSSKHSLKSTAKETYKETKHTAKAGAKVIKKEFKKGLRAIGLLQESQTKIGIATGTGVTGSAGTTGRPRSGSGSSMEFLTGGGGGGGNDSLEDGNNCDNGDNNNIRLSGIIWKRRSGLGKYSLSSSPWEQRRIILHGTKLVYYKTLRESIQQQGNSSLNAINSDDDDNDEQQSLSETAGVDDFINNNSSKLSTDGSGGSSMDNVDTSNNDSFSPSSWITHINNVHNILDKTLPGVSIPSWDGHGGGSSSKSVTARGYLDLCKERASVSASYGHTGAPTPFALSIKVASVTKWKLCFTTQQELMLWLTKLTDTVISDSIDDYNSNILIANDPSTTHHTISSIVGGDTTTTTGGTGIGIAGTSIMIGNSGLAWQEPPVHQEGTNTNTNTNTVGACTAGGHRLWSTEPYLVKSEDYPEVIMKSSLATTKEEEDGNDEDDYYVVGGSAEDYIIDTTTTTTTMLDDTTKVAAVVEEICGIPSKHMKKAIYLINVVICLSRSSTLSNNLFWYVIVFFNVLIVMVINTVQVGGTIKLKPGLLQKQLQQLQQGRSNKKRIGGGGKRTTAGGGGQDDTQTSLVTATSGDSSAAELNAAADEDDDEDFVPAAGGTSIKIVNPSDLPTKDGIIFAGWREGDPSTIQVRSHGYKTNKNKIPCPGDLYECVEVEVFESKKRVPDIASRVVLPKVTFDNDIGPKTWTAPDLFVISIALPTDPPKLYGGDSTNGGGFTITMYLKMRQETRDILRRVTANGYNPSDEKRVGDPNQNMVNAARLFDEWCRRAPTDDNFMARFKVIPQGNNLAEIGIPTWISKYNGKPFLIKRPGQTGFLYRHPEKSCMEFDISLHPFPYLAKQGICYLKDGYFKNILATFGFCIEGSNDDELPECLIGLFQLVSFCFNKIK